MFITTNNVITTQQTQINLQENSIHNMDINKLGSITFSNLDNCVFHIYNGNK